MDVIQAVKKLISILRDRLNYQTWLFLCTTLYRKQLRWHILTTFPVNFLCNFHTRCPSGEPLHWIVQRSATLIAVQKRVPLDFGTELQLAGSVGWSLQQNNKRAGRCGAPQASYDRRRHRNNFHFQTRPAQAFPKKVNISWGQRSVDALKRYRSSPASIYMYK